MYDIKWIRENAEIFDRAAAARAGAALGRSFSRLTMRAARRSPNCKRAQERRNAASKEIGAAMKAGDAASAEALKAEVARIKEDWPALEEAEREAIADARQCACRNSQHAAR